MHLGEADYLYIFEEVEDEYHLIQKRKAPAAGGGDLRWIEMAKLLSDCHSLLVSGVGSNPAALLKSLGINIIQMEGLIEDGLDAVFKGAPLRTATPKKAFKCGEACSGDGTGC